MNTQVKDRSGYLIQPETNVSDNLSELTPTERIQNIQIRKKNILHAAVTGVIVCVICAVVKFFIGYISNSLAVESDAMSSLTESYSYIISYIGITIAHKKPTKKHPNGFGRMEYLTAIVGGIFVIVAGWHYFESSFQRILNPQISTVSFTSLLVVGVTILGKLYLFKDDNEVGKKYSSVGLITASRNALLSSLSSVLVIISAIVAYYFKVDIDGWVGLIIALIIIYTGFFGIKSGITNIVGKPVSKDVGRAVTEILLKNYPIIGVYDLRLNDNGAGIVRGTVNAEVPDDINAEQIYDGFRNARFEVYRKLGIDLTIGLLTVNYCDKDVYPIFNEINNKVTQLKGVENLHGFKWNKDTNQVDLHVIVDYDQLNNNQELNDQIQNIIREYIPDSSILVDFNVNYLENKNDLKGAACKI